MMNDGRIPILDRDECLSLLASVSRARLAISVHALPHILLADFRLIDLGGPPELVIRIADGAKLLNAFRESVVAAEAEHLDPVDGTGWMVVLQGTARLVTEPDEISTATSAFGVADHVPHRFAAVRSDRMHGRLLLGPSPLTSSDSHVGLHPPGPGPSLTPSG
jgi:hypothetical protein